MKNDKLKECICIQIFFLELNKVIVGLEHINPGYGLT